MRCASEATGWPGRYLRSCKYYFYHDTVHLAVDIAAQQEVMTMSLTTQQQEEQCPSTLPLNMNLTSSSPSPPTFLSLILPNADKPTTHFCLVFSFPNPIGLPTSAQCCGEMRVRAGPLVLSVSDFARLAASAATTRCTRDKTNTTPNKGKTLRTLTRPPQLKHFASARTTTCCV